jgi:hypothetical protein
MKRLFLFTVLFCVVVSLSAQKRSRVTKNLPDWTNGIIVMQSGDTVRCDLRYSRMTPGGLLQVRENENVFTLTAKEVKAFSYFDEKKNATRNFYTFTVLPDPTEPSREFFLECIYSDANFYILNHKTIGYPHDYMEYTPFKRQGPINKQYIMDLRSGKVLPMSKENTLVVLSAHKTEIMTYIQTNGLKFKTVGDYINVFEYNRSL